MRFFSVACGHIFERFGSVFDGGVVCDEMIVGDVRRAGLVLHVQQAVVEHQIVLNFIGHKAAHHRLKVGASNAFIQTEIDVIRMHELMFYIVGSFQRTVAVEMPPLLAHCA